MVEVADIADITDVAEITEVVSMYIYFPLISINKILMKPSTICEHVYLITKKKKKKRRLVKYL